MGLDMYLEARKYIEKVDWPASRGQDELVITEMFSKYRELFPKDFDKYSTVQGGEVTVNIGYWRKANAIHDWFVTNCADGVDDCSKMRVSNEKLEQLLTAVTDVLKYKDTDMAAEYANSYLPPADGFFFGSTDIDEWYWSQLEYTKEMLEHVLSMNSNDEYDIIYQASW